MTQEQKEQLAREYAENEYKIGDAAYDKAMANLIERVYLDALDARDEEVGRLASNVIELNSDKVRIMCERDSIRSESRIEIEKLRKEIKQLKAELAKAKNPWISVEDRLPEKMPKSDYSDVVLIRDKGGDVGKARYCHQGYMSPRWEHWLYGSGIPSPNYWMPIP